VLAVDVDGVISLFGFDKEIHEAPGEFHLVDGMLHCISLPTGDRLNRLAERYELVWASGWEERANEHLPQILGIAEMPFLTFEGRARFGSAHWKLDPLTEYGEGRPLAWLDDNFDNSCFKWAEARDQPTLLVPTDPAIGLEEAHVAALETWVSDGFEP
jgi:hypothetical protein